MCFENVQGKALYSGKMGFGTAPRRYMIHSKPQPLLQKTYLFHASETLVVSMIALAPICRLLPTYAGRGLLWYFISKNKFLLI